VTNVTGVSGSGTYDITVATKVDAGVSPMSISDSTMETWPDYKMYPWRPIKRYYNAGKFYRHKS